MLTLQNLAATYGEGRVVDHIRLQANVGEVTCLVGRNGAGKSTTLKAIMGLIQTSADTLSLDGQDLLSLPTYDRARFGIGYVPQGRDIFQNMSVQDNLRIGLEANRQTQHVPDYIFDLFPILKDFLNRPGGDLSGGQQQQLAIARALVTDPKILILDEPTEGIQPSVIQEIGDVITKLKDKMAILIVEQYLEFVLKIADQCYLLEKGQILMSGPTATIDQTQLKHTLAL
ncbi:hypothetical protein FC83_GL001719 [Agrilactobacillus composti DSM 18527 = JCM 14202]|uniref:ABC transporter domain-containing protein n=1 Tax=Agrilactobacillus composti DSM 18527 = JCM 14202 TaxID=1423734 RepID=X0PCQ8_9LACO|nr:urea ABC transporter ATP-binding subunit UrtE [Agrilactobacillus composti]KRM30583.1 hypothetical protein FC83_GL001719 [Agrilactobacillus composti DSM 18527 = JCM 14202]GAF38343.1 urea ABC transporter, ATPase protein UrtE [Agrilactobacillus composti DSM 18527 = JCM 14202]